MDIDDWKPGYYGPPEGGEPRTGTAGFSNRRIPKRISGDGLPGAEEWPTDQGIMNYAWFHL